ncbi:MULTISPECIES: lasso peptide biosynthesis PqqD family chaperone [Actinomadura]|uniref:Lasso peptide biosynthesis PqqD family chaperone n=1 Tax=Actinomadura yumaensis TaxID=111807 RepID=A0ABW2CCB7_9ACTN|nr:lasso peptide biosynthesis PqqD family chaperone [Actinomadura sp. J1-007]MWK38212.1 lasso peptide biosynthesis PqqD family chaperone [Actinomadura sp. J1-007]
MAGVRLRAGVARTGTEYGTVLLDERRGRYFRLSPTAAAIVRDLEEGRGVPGTVRAVAERYGITEERAGADVQGLLARLRALGLVTS